MTPRIEKHVRQRVVHLARRAQDVQLVAIREHGSSPIFELIETFEFDMTLGDDCGPTRVELYRAPEHPNLHRCRVRQAESCRIQSTFPQAGGTPTDGPSDELILVEYSSYLRCDWDPSSFEASSPIATRELVEKALLAFLNHATGEPSPT